MNAFPLLMACTHCTGNKFTTSGLRAMLTWG